MRKIAFSSLALAIVAAAICGAAAARRRGPVHTEASTATLAVEGVPGGGALVAAHRPGAVSVGAVATIFNRGHLDGEDFWWSLEIGRDHGREVLWERDYRQGKFRVGRGVTEVAFAEDVEMPPGEYDVWLALRHAGTYYDRDGVTVLDVDPPYVAEPWRAVVW
jgi:hypothetical protein